LRKLSLYVLELESSKQAQWSWSWGIENTQHQEFPNSRSVTNGPELDFMAKVTSLLGAVTMIGDWASQLLISSRMMLQEANNEPKLACIWV